MNYHTQHLKLSDEERETLRQCEDDLGRTFVTQGQALKTIRDSRLYREEFDTFEDYCLERWGMTPRRANQLVAAVEALDTLGTIVPIRPETESQLRPLTTLRDAAGKMDPEKQRTAWAKAVHAAGDSPVTAKIVEEAVIAVRESSDPILKPLVPTETDAPPLPRDRFSVILADPPWQYNAGTTTPDRKIEVHYSTMTLEDICAMPIEANAEDDAMLFLWATSTCLPEALTVIGKWGFKYKSSIIWHKQGAPGMGHYARIDHELLLICTRGEPGTPGYADRPRSVIAAPKKRHSVKPALFHDLIDQMYPDGKRLELFGRARRDGWVVWGNQADGEATSQPELEGMPPLRGGILPLATLAQPNLMAGLGE